MRPGLVALGVALAALLAAGSLFFITEGAAFSRARHEWIVDVFAPGSGDRWAVSVPRLVIDPLYASQEDHDALRALLGEMAVRKGEADFELRADSLVLTGRGDASVGATRSFYSGPRGAFIDWTATGANVSREGDPSEARIQVTWNVQFSGGSGHTCWAVDSLTIFVGPGENEAFTFPSNADPYYRGRLWQTNCA